MGASSRSTRQSAVALVLQVPGQELRLRPGCEDVTLGRSAGAAMILNDRRVSRAHATISWRGTHFVITDRSSFGTWLYLGNQADCLVLRRSDSTLVGTGQIVLGCPREELEAPLISFLSEGIGRS